VVRSGLNWGRSRVRIRRSCSILAHELGSRHVPMSASLLRLGKSRVNSAVPGVAYAFSTGASRGLTDGMHCLPRWVHLLWREQSAGQPGEWGVEVASEFGAATSSSPPC
jgi:hypothetical protein